jgi:ribosomal protein S21
MSKVANVEVKIKETRGDISRLIKKFMKKCKKERVLEDYLDRRFYEKPSVKKRKAKIRAKAAARKAEAERNKELDIK